MTTLQMIAGAVALLLAATAVTCHAIGKDVVELTPANFDKLVIGSDDVWIVEFFAPWCVLV